jgi:hypothetical protein
VTSFLFADPSDLRAIAHRIYGHADQVRAQASTLVLAADSARWRSPAATTFRQQVQVIAADVHRAAGELDDAAAAMLRHADRVSHDLDFVKHELQAVAEGFEHAGSSIVHVGQSALHAFGL